MGYKPAPPPVMPKGTITMTYKDESIPLRECPDFTVEKRLFDQLSGGKRDKKTNQEDRKAVQY